MTSQPSLFNSNLLTFKLTAPAECNNWSYYWSSGNIFKPCSSLIITFFWKSLVFTGFGQNYHSWKWRNRWIDGISLHHFFELEADIWRNVNPIILLLNGLYCDNSSESNNFLRFWHGSLIPSVQIHVMRWKLILSDMIEYPTWMIICEFCINALKTGFEPYLLIKHVEKTLPQILKK